MAAYKELKEESLRGIAALSELNLLITQETATFHKAIVEVLHNKIYLKTDKVTKVVVVSEDDGKGGFTRMITGNQNRDNDFSSQEKKEHRISVLESQYEREAMASLVEAFWVLDHVRQGLNTIIERIRSEVRQVIQDCIVACNKELYLLRARSELKNARKPNANDIPEATSQFAYILKTLFKTLKAILANHQLVCREFQRRLEEKAENELPSLSQAEKGDYRTTYNIEFVWAEFQRELQSLIGIHIAAPKDTSNAQALSEVITGPKLFSFSSSSAYTDYAPEDEGEKITYADFDLEKNHHPTISLLFIR
jgi:hypothetical protein